MELRNGDDDMEITSSLKLFILKADHGLAEKIIVKHSRLFNYVKHYLKNPIYFNSIKRLILDGYIYGPFTLIIIMRPKASLTYLYKQITYEHH
jgi:hypothetical protein